VHLAGLHQFIEGTEGVLDRHLRIGGVQLVEVDTDGLAHVLRPGTLSLLIHCAAELRGNHYFVAAPTERAS
jgi:hypothetical protein